VADAVAWGTELAKRAPLSLAATKQAMRSAMDNDWGASFDLEASLQKDLLASEDAREGVAAFFEKRAPEFKGR
jgi:enoyl-CoA hydratase/carnithine racemase